VEEAGEKLAVQEQVEVQEEEMELKENHSKLDQALLQQHQSPREEEAKGLKGNHKKMVEAQLQHLQEEETQATRIARDLEQHITCCLVMTRGKLNCLILMK
jgi:hypothetical protein